MGESLETYLAVEAGSETRYEYYDGFIWAMAGGSPKHGQLAANVTAALHAALRAANKPCRVYSSDVKVAINTANRRFYPDVSVVCGPDLYDEKEIRAITNPLLIVEILSETTETLDRGDKFHAYRQLGSLREYLLISQDKMLTEVFSRNPDGSWLIQAASGLEEEVLLPSLGIHLRNSDVYFGLEGAG